MINSNHSKNRTGYIFFLIFLGLASGMLVGGHFSYRHYEAFIRIEVEQQLSAVAELKVDQLVHWRKELLDDANTIFRNDELSNLVKRYHLNQHDSEAKRSIQDWMKQISTEFENSRICLHDIAGIERFSFPEGQIHTSSISSQQFVEQLKTGKVEFQDFSRDENDKNIYLSIFVPVPDVNDNKKMLGIFAIYIDPRQYVYPMLEKWPTLSKTSETLLFRRDGNNVLYLNDLKFHKDAALNLRIPLERKDVLAVKAALGKNGVVEGIDYRGEPVIGYASAVPNSPWFMVARMDQSEVYAPLRERLWIILILVGALLIGAGASVGFIWRHQKLRYYREQYLSAEALRDSEYRYRRLFEAARDGIIILDAETGIIVDVNPFLIEIVGFSREQFLGKKIWELGLFKDIVANQDKFLELQLREYVRYEDLPLVTIDGRTIYVEFVSNVYLVDHHKVIQCNIRDITDRKRVEEELQKSESEFRSLFENMTEGVALHEMIYDYKGIAVDYRIVDVNEAFSTHTGISIENARGALASDLYGTGNAPYLTDYDKVVRSRKPITFEAHFAAMKKDFKLSAVSTKAGFFATIFLDITNQKRSELEMHRLLETSELSRLALLGILEDQKQTQDALSVLSSRQDAILSAVPDIIMEVNNDKVYTWANQSGINFFGEEVLGKEADFFFEGDQTTYAIVQPLFNGQDDIIYLESWQRRKDGEKRLLGWWCRVLKDENGTVIGALSSARDITETKRSENENKILNTRLQILISAIQQIAGAHDIDTIIRIVQMQSRKLVGSDGVAFILRENDNCYYVDEEAIGPLWKGQRFALSACIGGWVILNKQSTVVEDVFADARVTNDMYRSTFVKSLAIVPIRKEDPLGAIGNYWANRYLPSEMEVQLLQTLADAASRSIENVQLFEELEQRVNDRTKELSQANKELEAFSYSVSHDLRAPLRAIDGFSRIMLEDYADQLDETGKSNLNVIRKNAQKMSQLISDLLALARVSRLAMVSEQIDMGAIAQAMYYELVPPEQREKISLHIEPLPWAAVDPILIRQVWTNLLSNAIKYSSKTENPEIIVSGSVRTGEVQYAVRDNGVGFDMRHAEKLFGVFNRLHTTQEFEGTGVGLAIMSRIIHRHGGRVWAEGVVGKGATFYFTIPVKE